MIKSARVHEGKNLNLAFGLFLMDISGSFLNSVGCALFPILSTQRFKCCFVCIFGS